MERGYDEKQLHLLSSRIVQQSKGFNSQTLISGVIWDLIELNNNVVFKGAVFANLANEGYDMTINTYQSKGGKFCTITVQGKRIVVDIASRIKVNLKSSGRLPDELFISWNILICQYILCALIAIAWKLPKTTSIDCIAKQFFSNINVDLFDRFIEIDYKHVPQIKGYSWWEDSCNIDSLLMIMIVGGGEQFMRRVQSVDTDTTEYNITLCRSDSKVDTIEKIRKVAKVLQKVYIEDFNHIHKGGDKECRDIRTILQLCYPDMKRRSGFTQYDASSLYNLFAEFFPSLSIRTMQYRKAGEEIEWRKQDMTMIPMWDYLSDDYRYNFSIDWNRINSEFLVFQNTFAPSLTHYDQTGIETIVQKEYSSERNKMVNIQIEYEKVRKFEENILDDRYELFGVIMHKGASPTASGVSGGHYVSWVKTDGVWFYYNDVSRKRWVNKPLSDDVWEAGSTSRPQLYFYRKR